LVAKTIFGNNLKFKTIHYIWCLLLAGLIGFIIYVKKNEDVFPSASIDLKLGKQQIQTLADQWKSGSSYKPKSAEVKESTTFTFDDDAKTFLEYELGTTEANNLMRSQIPVWYWSTRCCEPLQQEEFSCWLGPKGDLIAFDHSIENDIARPSTTHELAKQKCQDRLSKNGHVDLTNYKLIEDGSIEQAHRTDHYFTWEDQTKDYKGARMRAYAYVAGDEVTAINHYLKIPEAFKRKFANLRSYNDALEGVATIFYEALTAGIFFVFLWAFANGQLRWRFALSVAIFYATFAVLESINSWPAALHDYSTTTPFISFQLDFCLKAIWSGISTLFEIFTLVAAAECVYRLARPNFIALEKILTTGGMKTNQVFQSMLAGIGAFGLHLGWLIFYYLVGRSFNFWCPLEVSNAETLSSYSPAFSALNVGFSASLTEEMTYRVLGLLAFQRLVKNFWLANLMQAAAWAFMHSNYAQEPPFARGLELTVIGTIYGAIMQQFGLLGCVLSHNLIDTFLGLAPLFASSAVSMKISAYIAIAPLVLVALLPVWHKLKSKRMRSAVDLTNRSISPAPTHSIAQEVQHTVHSYAYVPRSNATRLILSICILVAASVEFGLHVKSLGHQADVTFSRESAIKAARKVLIDRDLRPDNFMEVAWIQQAYDTEEFQYVYELARDRVQSLSRCPETPLIWVVRFFKPLSGDEYKVIFDEKGKLLEVGVTLEEDEAGANLTKEQALAKVEEYFRKLHPEMLPFVLDDSSSSKKENRTDWTFTFKLPRFRAGAADYKVTIECKGDQPCGFANKWSVPDEWSFKRKIETWQQTTCRYITYAIEFVLLVLMIIWGRGVVRASSIPWRPAMMFGAGMAALSFAKNLNNWPMLFYSYNANAPLNTFFVSEIASWLLQAIYDFSMATGLAAFGLGSLRLLLPPSTSAAILRTTITPSKGREMMANRQIWLDAALIGLSFGIGWQALNVFTGFLRFKFSPEIVIAPLTSLSSLANYMDPAIAIILEGLHEGFQYLFSTAILVGLYAKFLRNPRMYFVTSLAFCLIWPSTNKYWQDYGVDAVWYFSSSLLLWALIRIAKENFAAYFLTAATGALVAYLRVLISHGGALYEQDIITGAVSLLVPLAYVLYASLNTQTRESEESPPQIDMLTGE
jgi:hypothetical protein